MTYKLITEEQLKAGMCILCSYENTPECKTSDVCVKSKYVYLPSIGLEGLERICNYINNKYKSSGDYGSEGDYVFSTEEEELKLISQTILTQIKEIKK